MKTDYPELEGKEIELPMLNSTGKVVGCNYHVGITIVSKDGQKACLVGKQAPAVKSGEIELFGSQWTYRRLFHCWVKMIQNGRFEYEPIFAIRSREKCGYGGREVCPYGS